MQNITARNILFYTRAEKNRVLKLLLPVVQAWASDWSLHDELPFVLDVVSADEKNHSEASNFVYTGKQLHVARYQPLAAQLPAFFTGSHYLLGMDIALAMLSHAINALLRQMEIAIDKELYLIDVGEFAEGVGNGILCISLKTDFFTLDILCCPQNLRRLSACEPLQALDKSVLVQDCSCYLHAFMGESTVKAEDIYLLQSGDVIKLDQSLQDMIFLKTPNGDTVGQGALCALDNSLAITMKSGI